MCPVRSLRRAPMGMPAARGGLARPVSAAPAVATTPTPPVPSPRTAGLAIGALALGGFAIGTTEFVTMGLLPDIAAGVDASIPSGGHLISAYALGVVVGAPVIAALGARLPRRGLAVALMTAFVVGNALSALAPGFGTLVVRSEEHTSELQSRQYLVCR